MKTVKEVSRITGVSVRTLHHYDAIGLLKPTQITEAGYRLYDDTALERMQQILLFRELEFSLKEISEMIDAPDFDKNKALDQQIELLLMKKEHLEHLYLPDHLYSMPSLPEALCPFYYTFPTFPLLQQL